MTAVWRWFSRELVILAHDEQLVEHGGAAGLRDAGLLDSALARPQQLAAYGDPDVFDLAAAYAFGIARNHPFVDGNKRTAFLLAEGFVRIHGQRLRATDEQALVAMLSLAAGDIDQDRFAAWLRQHCAVAER
ncbi:MAG TPA: type II toxin-antitoxin system death-on-curing family toxin [Pseudomonadota bacterium]|nr:type II toxin-antitoxin system death-on-curing family toxin [Pseudomonadota bacterium]